MADFIVEILSEEMPARMQQPAVASMEAALTTRLKEEGLFFSKAESFVTPRRMTLVVEGLSLTQEDTTTERKGPKVGAADQAIDGFAKSTGLSRDMLEVRTTPKGEFYFATIHNKGKPTKDVLKAAMEEILSQTVWPKSMRWNAYPTRWVRPVNNVMSVFGGDVLPLSLGHVVATNQTIGHRFLGNAPITVDTVASYKDGLQKAYVMLDQAKRKQVIVENARRLAAEKNLTLLEDDALLDEVAGLVEWPVMLLGSIDKRFMHIPEEALISSIRAHQKYFCLRQADGSLAPYFIVASNMECEDNGAAIIAGNERVLRARLSDAKFFWDQDRKIPLIERTENLEKVIFHAKLGTIAQKSQRMVALSKFLAVWVPHANLEQVERAATLSKADLTTEMVGEFPDLQGLMGEYYAKDNGEPQDVAKAIKEHYAPLGPKDICPTAPVSVAVALADKIDTLVGLFAVNERPTGSKDPFALRRSALGVIRLILDNHLSFNLRTVLHQALSAYPSSILKQESEDDSKGLLPRKKAHKTKPDEVVEQLLGFFADRLKALLKAENVRHDLISAVFNDGKEDNILHIVQRVAALTTLLETDDGANLLAAYRRAANIVHIEEKKDAVSYAGSVSKSHLAMEEEIALHTALTDLKPKVQATLKEHDYQEAMRLISGLRAPIDTFFEQVTVNADDPELRKNRLRLLSVMRDTLHDIANFSYIEG